mmetsp:Transcript_46127/g.93104  ORF Transcript_46127/g.93104 Transcript_46127/m.93104 type:complete len:234 (+) Transcript_46127:149-850(+)|eukprot:CAMPEP_0171625910 /NCGR_PEP_ID=MMETSP0990-20121206/19695_1 /TAXON_ID=483369 /ORGANISM="non described non described, Strain CCMP2098" /LENGTH=233 /DNA_ID=CAMNT_0012193139 /DNA_START=120 /DNA_END=821 /DNA_ORIENTATION=+
MPQALMFIWLSCLAPAVVGFTLPSPRIQKSNSPFFHQATIESLDQHLDNPKDKPEEEKTTFDLNEYRKVLVENVHSSGEPGKRGELATYAPLAVILCIGIGTVPLVGESVKNIVSVGLLAAGVALAGTGARVLGGQLSPFPQPTPNANLITKGSFDIVRHPMYSGVLLSSMGFALLTDSASRLVLTIILYFVIREKVRLEEKFLLERFENEYKDYKSKVPWPIVPFMDLDLDV